MEITEEELGKMTPEQIAELQRQNCVFCQIASGKVPAKKIFEDDDAIAVLDINPAAEGHILLMPKEHYAVMPQIPDAMVQHLFIIAKKLSQALLKSMKVKGTSIFVANGLVAGQKAPHVMIHIIPRKDNDAIGLRVPQGNVSESELLQVRNAVAEKLGSAPAKKPKQQKKESKKPAPKKKEEKKSSLEDLTYG